MDTLYTINLLHGLWHMGCSFLIFFPSLVQVESYFESGKWHNIIHRTFTIKSDANMEVISNLFWQTTPVFSEHYLVV